MSSTDKEETKGDKVAVEQLVWDAISDWEPTIAEAVSERYPAQYDSLWESFLYEKERLDFLLRIGKAVPLYNRKEWELDHVADFMTPWFWQETPEQVTQREAYLWALVKPRETHD